MSKALWSSSSPEKWQEALDNHQKALGHIGNDKLTELESWFQEQLPVSISSREAPHMEKADLVKMVEWKLTRGKWRPNLLKFAEQQPKGEVEEASEKAFADLDDTPQKAKAALSALSALKGVGPATASAGLSAACPHIPFMSDELLEAATGGRDYTDKAFVALLAAVTKKVEGLREASERHWTAREVERALWATAVLAGESRGKAAASSKRSSEAGGSGKGSKAASGSKRPATAGGSGKGPKATVAKRRKR